MVIRQSSECSYAGKSTISFWSKQINSKGSRKSDPVDISVLFSLIFMKFYSRLLIKETRHWKSFTEQLILSKLCEYSISNIGFLIRLSSQGQCKCTLFGCHYSKSMSLTVTLHFVHSFISSQTLNGFVFMHTEETALKSNCMVLSLVRHDNLENFKPEPVKASLPYLLCES